MNKKYIQKNYINLCSKVLGTKIHRFSDQFFGSASRLLKEEQPIFKEGVYAVSYTHLTLPTNREV